MKKTKLLSSFLAVLMVVSLSGATTNAVTLDQSDDYIVGIVYSTGGLGDQSFNDAAKRGIDAALDTYDNLTVYESCESGCTTIPDVTQAIIDMGNEDVDYDLIIGVGFSAADGINASAIAHPNINYMIIDSIVELDNVNSVVFKEHEGSFLVGAMAAMVTETEKIAFLGGLDNELINRFLAGYADGAQYINENITVAATYSPDPSNPWGDIDGGKRVGQAYIDDGYDIIYSAAGGTGLGVIDAVAEGNDADGEGSYYAIGVDSNQDNQSAGDVLTSMVKRVDVAVENEIGSIIDGTWDAGQTSLGLAEDGVGITGMEFTQEEANTDYNSTHTRLEVIDGLKQMIIDGDIEVKSLKSEVDIQEFSLSGDFLPLPGVPVFLAFMASIAVIVRRKRE